MTQQEPQKTSESFNAVGADGKIVLPFIHLSETQKGDKTEIRIRDLSVNTPMENRSLIKHANLTIKSGDRVAFTGPNGGGKSSLFRAIRGLNSEGGGSISVNLAEEKEIFYAAQEIRRTPATLDYLMAYPHFPDHYNREDYEDALRKAGLSQAVAHLPWNAATARNIVPLVRPQLEWEFRNLKGRLSQGAVDTIVSSFKKRLEKSQLIPKALNIYDTEELNDELVETLGDIAAEILTPDPKQPQDLILFPRRLGRKKAKSMQENMAGIIDGWLLQGHRLTLSGGEQQRMVFARAFMQAAETGLLLMDEPTSALKSDTAHELIGKLFETIPEDCATIAIVHDNSLLRHFTHHLELGHDKTLTLTELKDGEPVQKRTCGNENKPGPKPL